MAKLLALFDPRRASFTLLGVATLFGASSCGYYDNTRQRFLDAGGISSSGNKTDDEELEDQEKTDDAPMSDGGSADTDAAPGSVAPQECDETEAPRLKGKTFGFDGAANAPAADCKGDHATGRIECAATLRFISKKEIEIDYADVAQDDDAGRTARHRWAGCHAAVEVYVERQVGVLEAHGFTLSDDGAKLSHVATGRTFILDEAP